MSSDGRWTLNRVVDPVVPDVAISVQDVEVFRAERFPPAGPTPWLDRPDAHKLVKQRRRARELTSYEAELCHKWIDDGYVIVESLFDDDELDWAWEAYEAAISDARLVPPEEKQAAEDDLPGRLLDPHLTVPELAEMQAHPANRHVVELLLGVTAVPFQTITGHKASQQAVHSDSIHMTTYPEQYLLANWIAFEDISPDSGPLELYPGSHRLPVVYSKDVGIAEDSWAKEHMAAFTRQYTPFIIERAADYERQGHPKAYFHGNKGDVLFWHANLLHGGSDRTNFRRSRRSLVCHYFADGCICYHDLGASVSRVHRDELSPSDSAS